MKRIAAILAMIFLLTSCTTNIEPPAPPTLPVQSQPPIDSVTPPTTIEESPDPEPTDDASRPYSPFPSEIPYTEPKPKDPDYVAPVSDMDFSVPGIYEVEENMTYSVDLDGDGVLKPLTIWDTSYEFDALWEDRVIKGWHSGETWIEYGDEKIELPDEHPFYCAIMRREDGSAALFISSNDYDFPLTEIIAIKDGRFEMIDRIDQIIVELSFDCMEVEGDVYYFLGNQYLYGTVGLSNDFTIIYPEDGFFNVTRRTEGVHNEYVERQYATGVFGNYEPTEPIYDPDGFIYTSLVDLQLSRIVEDGFVEETMPAGTRIRPLKMNLELTRAIIESTDGKLWLLVPEEDYPPPVHESFFIEDGIFDGCIHAGP